MHEQVLLSSAKEIRNEAPRIGALKLYGMLCGIFGHEKMLGRDSFFNLLRRYGLMLKPLKSHCTTNSNHRFHKYKNLIKGLSITSPNQVWVSDITYIDLEEGLCYLHLVTDAYSHKIIGCVLAPGLHPDIRCRLWKWLFPVRVGNVQTVSSITLTGVYSTAVMPM